MRHDLWARLLGYAAFLALGGLAAYLLGFRLARDPHVALAVLGVWLLGLVALVSWGEVRPWAGRRGAPRPSALALTAAGVAALLWVAYVGAVSLPLAFLTDITATPQGRRLLGVVTFLPLVLCYAAGLWLAWRLLGAPVPTRQ